ncbi:MAG: RlmE family RNA methyltransferase [Polaribacter sp.]|jgi:23S rRNA (uridine2552-2'-O)-methyltransferase|nr:RlmE family RNA methyltransferase [Polaribacter sp.]
MPKSFNPNDIYARKAKKEGFLARSAFKLEFILEKFPIIKNGDKVLDAGASPGSWLQVVSSIIGKNGLAVGIDLNPIEFNALNIKNIQCDILKDECIEKIKDFAPFDSIISDLAPKTSGIKIKDQALSEELAEKVLELANIYLKKHGSVIIKIFQGAEMQEIIRKMRSGYKNVHTYKPPASRERSFETYLIGINKVD